MQYQNLTHFSEHVDNLLDRLPLEEAVVDLQPLFFALTLDTTTALLFGQSVYSLRTDSKYNAENREFSESFTIAQEGLAKRFRIAPLHFLYNPPRFRRACATVHRFVEKYIEDIKTNPESSKGFLGQVREECANDKDLRDQLLNVLLAGRDTTACCLSWTL
jgi:cytochrome P450